MSEGERRAYAMGAVNGLLVAPFLGAPEAKAGRLGRCIENMTDEDVAAVIEDWIRTHPERWHHGLHVEAWLAIKETCKTRRPKGMVST